MKTFSLGSSLLIASIGIASGEPKAIFSANDLSPNDGILVNSLTIDVFIDDGSGSPVKKAIILEQSAIANPQNWTLEWTSNGKTSSFAIKEVAVRPSSGSRVTEVSATAPDLGDADPSQEGEWKLRVVSAAGKPALSIEESDGTTQVHESLELSVVPLSDDDKDFTGQFNSPVEPGLSMSGGEDGAILGLEFAWDSGYRINEQNEIAGFHLDFEGNFTPDPEDALTMYGRILGNAGLVKGVKIPTNPVANGNLLIDINSRIESDQQFDNYNESLGAGVWGFVTIAPLEKVAEALRLLTNLGNPSDDKASVVTLYAGYDNVFESEREAGIAESGEDRLRFRARYRFPLREKLDLPFIDSDFQVDAIADVSSVYDLDIAAFQTEWSPSLEFSPIDSGSEKMAFTLSYKLGEIAPTFVDEEAFLAGLKFRF